MFGAVPRGGLGAHPALTRRHGLDAALAMRAAMRDTVDEVGKAVAQEGIACE